MAYIADSFDDKIIDLLNKGRVGFMPSDTIYGLSCRALDELAVKRVHKLKKRDKFKPFIILISDLGQLEHLGISSQMHELVKQYWPGALTIVFDAPKAPEWLQMGSAKLAVRQPDYPELLELMKITGPLISTSANLQNGQPTTSLNDAELCFGDKLDFYVDAGDLSDNLPSTIVKLEEGRLKLIRQGGIKL